MTLNERRAVFIYEAARLQAGASGAPIVPAPWPEREADFKEQFLRVIALQMGPQRSSSPEELHGSWMQAYLDRGWQYGEKYDPANRRHPDLVPYAQLGTLERDKDAVFVALCEIARLWVRGDDSQASGGERPQGEDEPCTTAGGGCLVHDHRETKS